MTAHPSYWLPFLETTTHKGRKELLFTSIPETISSRELVELAEGWVKREIIPHGIICEITVYRDRAIEIWCTTREALEDGFGERLPVWKDAYFLTHLCQTFGETINAALARKQETA